MSKTSLNKAITLQQLDYFYGNEILPDFRTRKEATLKDLATVPPDEPTEIGMPTINPKSELQKYFVEFCSGSTMLGFNHIVAPNRHPFEKFLVILVVGIALMLLALLSITFWNRYQYEATVIVVDNDFYHFILNKPAVFICPVPNIEKSKIPEVFKNYSIEYTPETEKFFTFLANVDYGNMNETPNFDQVPPTKWLKILYEIRKDIPSQVLKEPDPYAGLVMTERGFCSVNRSPVAVYSTYEYWMNNNWTVVPEPEELVTININDDRSQESFATRDDALFAVIDPNEILLYNSPMKWMKPKILQRPIMMITLIQTKPNVRELQVHQRRCKFSSDGGLQTWPIYSKNMCIVECRMRTIQHLCKCRPHFARPIDGIEICNSTQLRCIASIKEKLFLFTSPPKYCKCIPSCDNYEYSITDTKISEIGVPSSSSTLTLITYFPSQVFYRTLLYGFTDFLSSVGGAAGLLLGASVLSFVEIIYFMTLHACFYARRASQKKKKRFLGV
ncbi:pickpocket protein 19 [Augochlora pura]